MVALKVFDDVQIKSGGVGMTVILIREQQYNDFDKTAVVRQIVMPEFATAHGKKKAKSLVALCRWMDGSQVREEIFPLGALKRAKPK